jgi:hypothetical protein
MVHRLHTAYRERLLPGALQAAAPFEAGLLLEVRFGFGVHKQVALWCLLNQWPEVAIAVGK